MKKTKSLFFIILLTLSLVILPPGFVLGHDALTNTQKEDELYKNLLDKDKPAIVVIRVEVLPPNLPNKNSPDISTQTNFKLPIYQETIIYEDYGINRILKMGTGFIITPDGELLTNHHVIEGYNSNNEIFITMANGNTYKALVIGYNAASDLALLKIDTQGKQIIFPVLALGDSDSIKEVQHIMTIGHPLFLEWTPSLGVISTLERFINIHPSALIQIQSSVNPGNSGSPVITPVDNKVVGIIQSMPTNVSTIGFAIPINYVKKMLATLRAQKNQQDAPDK